LPDMAGLEKEQELVVSRWFKTQTHREMCEKMGEGVKPREVSPPGGG